MESKTKVLGHPVHTQLIVFPLGLLSTSIVFDLLHLATRKRKMGETSFFLLASGLVGALAAAPFGTRDWWFIPQGTRAKTVGLWHGAGTPSSPACSARAWLLRRDDPGEPGAAPIALSLAGGALAGVTGWLGGEARLPAARGRGRGGESGRPEFALRTSRRRERDGRAGHGRAGRRRQLGIKMPRPLNRQTVVITGASSGVGLETAIEAGKRGASVVLAARSEEALGEAARQIGQAGGTALVVPTDVGDWEQVRRLAGAAVEHFGRIDTWVNNASVSTYARVEETTPEEIDRVVQVNLLGTIYGAMAALPYLKQQGGGRSSTWGRPSPSARSHFRPGTARPSTASKDSPSRCGWSWRAKRAGSTSRSSCRPPSTRPSSATPARRWGSSPGRSRRSTSRVWSPRRSCSPPSTPGATFSPAARASCSPSWSRSARPSWTSTCSRATGCSSSSRRTGPTTAATTCSRP